MGKTSKLGTPSKMGKTGIYYKLVKQVKSCTIMNQTLEG